MMQLKNSGLPALKSGRSSVVELRFVLTVYKPRVLVFSICVAYTWTVDTVHLVTCFFLAFEWGRKSVVSALHYLSQPLWLSRAAKPMLSLRRRMESISREGREVGVLNVTRHPMSSKWSQSSVSRRAVQRSLYIAIYHETIFEHTATPSHTPDCAHSSKENAPGL